MREKVGDLYSKSRSIADSLFNLMGKMVKNKCGLPHPEAIELFEKMKDDGFSKEAKKARGLLFDERKKVFAIALSQDNSIAHQ
jgi:hypothetical protein